MRWICATPTGCQMNKQSEVYYFHISHLLSRYFSGFQFHLSNTCWAALGLTVQAVSRRKKREAVGLGWDAPGTWLRGHMDTVRGWRGSWLRGTGTFLEFRVLDPHPLTPLVSSGASRLLTGASVFLPEECIFHVILRVLGPGANVFLLDGILLFPYVLKIGSEFWDAKWYFLRAMFRPSRKIPFIGGLLCASLMLGRPVTHVPAFIFTTTLPSPLDRWGQQNLREAKSLAGCHMVGVLWKCAWANNW